MNNTIRIIISGGIATIIQALAQVNPISILGFTLFMLIFMIVSFSIVYFFPSKDIAIKEPSLKIQLFKTRALKTLKIIFFVFIAYIIVNSLINFISYKLKLLDGNLTFYYDKSQALVIGDDYKKIDKFKFYKKYYHLVKFKNKYYVINTKDKYLKKSYIVSAKIHSPTTLYHMLRQRDDFQDILNNISPVKYTQISISTMMFKPLWFINTHTNIKWSNTDKDYAQKQYDKYINKKVLFN